MQIPKNVVEKAIEGGWKPWEYVGQPQESFTDILALNENDQALIALDSTFWQALGKACGWEKYTDTYYMQVDETPIQELSWLWNAHRFYDLVLNNKPTDEFWAELIS